MQAVIQNRALLLTCWFSKLRLLSEKKEKALLMGVLSVKA